jgi:hypothetical protein
VAAGRQRAQQPRPPEPRAIEHRLHGEQRLVVGNHRIARAGFGWTRLLRALATSRHVEPTLDSFGLSYADLDLATAR